MPSLTPSSTSLERFREILSRYPAAVPSKLHDLDTLRFETIPTKVAERAAQNSGSAWLEKDEVLQLVEWKLKHGTYRPTLLALVSRNSPDTIVDTTRAAFAALSPLTSQSVNAALSLLTPLSGIGPATASLFLSVARPAEVPFFSDEVFRWISWEEAEVKGKGTGWGRKIGYTAKEYRGVVEGVEQVRERLGVGAGELERVAWVLGREGVDVGVEEGVVGEEGEEGEGNKKVDGKGQATEKKKEGRTASKASDTIVKTEESRRSKRKPAVLDPTQDSKPTKRRLK